MLSVATSGIDNKNQLFVYDIISVYKIQLKVNSDWNDANNIMNKIEKASSEEDLSDLLKKLSTYINYIE